MKLAPPEPEEFEPLEAHEPVDVVEPKKAPAMLPDISADDVLDLRQRANTWVTSLSELKPKSPEYTEQVRAISKVARREITATTSSSSRFLDKSLAQAKSAGGEGHAVTVSKSLVDLRNIVQELQPENNPGLVGRLLRKVPGVKQLQRYFRQYETNQAQLNVILRALENGQDALRKDNAALAVERRTLWEAMIELQKLSGLLSELDTALVDRIADLNAEGDVEAAQALDHDALFAVRQRHVDVQTQIAVSVQSYLSMDLIQDNNLKLIDGVERAKTTTMTALRTAIVVAQALENQKLVLDQIDAVNSTTSQMIEQTSAMLRDNSARIQQQAVSSTISLDTLQRAYDNIFTAIDDVEKFRANANENFAVTITNLQSQLERARPYVERSRENELQRGEGGPALLP
ncbi:toxic anion resistance protein [Gulosibacter sediminis]|uniref:toxic anion resistance protein n=1 Tax=Gulosibacter sediminis TaxID=1729695 RepID=UPI001868E69C|nr:toxic anion resistance protein [Gulosibacter sediminis]